MTSAEVLLRLVALLLQVEVRRKPHIFADKVRQAGLVFS
jgi:hypothetical protein